MDHANGTCCYGSSGASRLSFREISSIRLDAMPIASKLLNCFLCFGFGRDVFEAAFAEPSVLAEDRFPTKVLTKAAPGPSKSGKENAPLPICGLHRKQLSAASGTSNNLKHAIF
eukprot:TRINITY_DN29497_c0_g1_i2.p2 TRINITY_DN29497_c0_g1~~TRINITY_DN29497_c0_g1_i2.p2  ORF type:complete len:114 (-),score=21.80 TRINITY_DN29497_c0_g1_i2:98-439(-)